MTTITEEDQVTLAWLRRMRKTLGSPDSVIVTVPARLAHIVCGLPGFVGRKNYSRAEPLCIDEFGASERFRFRCHIPDGTPWRTEIMRATGYDVVALSIMCDAL